MVGKVATACLHWSQPILPHSQFSSQTLISAILSFSSRKGRNRCDGGALVCRYVQRLDRFFLLESPCTRLQRSRPNEQPKSRFPSIKRACSASSDDFSDEEFSKKIQELALRFQLYDCDGEGEGNEVVSDFGGNHSEETTGLNSCVNFMENQKQFLAPKFHSWEPAWPELRGETSDWPGNDEIVLASIERKANSVDLPLSLRIIKRKLHWQEGVREAGESAYCSVKKAFSSMVFIIRELHCYTLQMREILYHEDLQAILSRVQKEMHASFAWLFQQVFSHTPTLMVYVMILLANFTVYSMGHNTAIAASSPPGSHSSTTEIASMVEVQDHKNQKFDSSTIKTFSVNSSSGKATSIGGNNGGGGNFRQVASGTDGDGRSNESGQYRKILPDGSSQLSSMRRTEKEESISEHESKEEEEAIWNSIVEEASEIEASLRDEALDNDTVQRFVSPVNAKIEPDGYEDHFRTDLQYQSCLSQEPNNALLLANYAQFLYLVSHDYDRAEKYFKRAIAIEPPDAEAYNKYATFLWKVRNDLWAAEETFLEAIDAEPGNAYHAATYANFLWNTGGEDTCFPLGSSDDPQSSC